jgi:CHASE3 domain sensor protein
MSNLIVILFMIGACVYPYQTKYLVNESVDTINKTFHIIVEKANEIK